MRMLASMLRLSETLTHMLLKCSIANDEVVELPKPPESRSNSYY